MESDFIALIKSCVSDQIAESDNLMKKVEECYRIYNRPTAEDDSFIDFIKEFFLIISESVKNEY